MFDYIESEDESVRDTCIKVIGVGGAGCNAVDHMINCNVQGVEFIAANTDAQTLRKSLATTKISLGDTGLGAGAKPEAGRAAAEEHREALRSAIEGAHMLFITAGMGGGTGTGAAPIVAEIARDLGILTVGVVTKPFLFEGNRRCRSAEGGIIEFTKNVDSLIVILNDNLMPLMGEHATFDECFRAADDVLKNAVGGIAEIINNPGLVNVDFEDVRTVMNETGRAMMGSAIASGDDRARIAAEQAIASPLLEGVDLMGARGVLVNITGTRAGLKLLEVNRIMETIKKCASEDSHIIFGAVFDETMEDNLRVTVVASGLGGAVARREKFEVLSSQSTGTYDAIPTNNQGQVDYNKLEIPSVIRNPRQRSMETTSAQINVPSFLRKQAD